MDKYPMPKDDEENLDIANLVFFCIFFFEMIIKIAGYGIKIYLRNSANVFDMIIVLVSTIDVGIFINA
jgi:hypothetical protein